MSTESREKLAKQQAAVLNALLGTAVAPPGFNDARLQAASSSLIQQRERTAVTVRPTFFGAFKLLLSRILQNKMSAISSLTPVIPMYSAMEMLPNGNRPGSRNIRKLGCLDPRMHRNRTSHSDNQ